jgi:hypothetical protein
MLDKLSCLYLEPPDDGVVRMSLKSTGVNAEKPR